MGACPALSSLLLSRQALKVAGISCERDLAVLLLPCYSVRGLQGTEQRSVRSANRARGSCVGYRW